jgi:hypothetical protein
VTTKKVVYVLVSDPQDHYAEMAILSMECLKKYSPGINIEVVIDSKTNNNLSGYRDQVKKLADIVHITDIIGQNNAFTSRMIKTQLRSLVKGDYLYIDIDAVPVKPLDELFNSSSDIAMVHDLNTTSAKFTFHDYEREIFDAMAWELPKQYFNSGVMFVKDNKNVNDFFKTWHLTWQKSSKNGLHKDQPPMHEAIRQSNITVKELAPEYNMLISIQKGVAAKTAKVYHYSTVRFDSRNDTYFHDIIKQMKISESINWALLSSVLSSKYPWTNHDSLRLNWATGNYQELGKILFKRALNTK